MTKQTALIVDDSRTAQMKLQRMLRSYPLEISTADSAEEALDYLNTQRPTVIFMDHSMPGMDGLEALRIIRSNPDTAPIPVIMYTAQKGEVYVGQAEAAGANEVLSKDVMDDQSLEKVLRFVRLTPNEKAAATTNKVTSISTRSSSQLDVSKAMALGLRGRSSSLPSEETSNASEASQSAKPARAVQAKETKKPDAPWEDAITTLASQNQEMLEDALAEMKQMSQKQQIQPKYVVSPPPAPRQDDSKNTGSMWPTIIVVGLLLYISYQLAEIRGEQSEIDRSVREIQIRTGIE